MLDAGGLDARLGLIDAGFDLDRGRVVASVLVIAVRHEARGGVLKCGIS